MIKARNQQSGTVVSSDSEAVVEIELRESDVV